MSTKLILTKMQINHEVATNKELLVAAKIENDHLTDLNVISDRQGSLINHVFIGRVDKIAENIHAFFVKFGPNETCYVPYSDAKYAIFTKKLSKKSIAVGDELLIQIVRDPIKTKLAAASTAITLSGQYVVLSSNKKQSGVSKKITGRKREHLSELMKEINDEYPEIGIVARTNAKHVSKEEILNEAHDMAEVFNEMLKTAPYKTRYTCIYKAMPEYLNLIKNSYKGEFDEIITDDKEKFDTITEYMNTFPETLHTPLRFYNDSYPLEKLFSLQREISQALDKVIWLKSGSYLVIEYTEAMTVIDVNSGKNANKDFGDFFLTINLEAAKEIARQLKIRNISGMCMIDFIDMKDPEHKSKLIDTFRELLSKDHITTTLVDMTKLNLVEVTRKKVNRPLIEQVREENA
ncbi:MAG: ribonuclease E/G [Lachnospiraceae bacterium]|nr:ribonuclease E/G [Lachnospiraceae bacterium]